MTPRFYAPGARAPGDVVPLPADEAQHLFRVLRLRPGDRVRVFDGCGHEFEAVVVNAGKGGATVRLGAGCEAAPEPRVAVTLAAAVLKGDKADEVLRDAVMMGVAAVQPLVTARTEPTLASAARRLERWQRIAVASAKQCGRAVVPQVLAPCSFDALVEALGARPPRTHASVMLVEPRAGGRVRSLSELPPAPAAATVLVGPEGGWTPEEIARASEACDLVALGGRTLRADAMAVAALATLFTVWGEY